MAKERRYASMRTYEANGDVSLKFAFEELQELGKLDIEITQLLKSSVISAYRKPGLKRGDIFNTIKFLRYLYNAIHGNLDGFNEFIQNNRVVCFSSYSNFKCRLAIFNHFGLLDDVLENHIGVLTNDFNLVGTKDFYRIFSTREISSVEEFKFIVTSMSVQEINSLRNSVRFESSDIRELDQELMNELERRKKKSMFLQMLKKR